MNSLSPKALALILSFEGLDQPSKWPGASSGITLGHGFDIGYQTRAEFLEAWSRHLIGGHMQALSAVIGLRGTVAKSRASRFVDIHITPAMADEVFTRCTVPRILTMVKEAFPGVQELPADAGGALASLVFNRGTSMKGDSRREMLSIRNIVRGIAATDRVLNGDLRLIAQQIRGMKRLWDINKLRGLHRRRDAEAALVESCITGKP